MTQSTSTNRKDVAMNLRFVSLALLLVVITSCSSLNGTYIEPSRGATGECQFTIANYYDEDIVVKVFSVEDLQNHVHYVYVSSGNKATIPSMAPGNYVMRYSKGRDWDAENKQFKVNRKNFEVDQNFEFETKEYVNEYPGGKQTMKQSSHQIFTLGSRSGRGNVTTQEIPDAEFSK